MAVPKTVISLDPDNIPEELKKHKNWVLFKLEPKKDKEGNPEKKPDGTPKYTKPPYKVNGYKASTTEPDTWDTFANVVKAFEKGSGKFSGIGFVFTQEIGYVGIDFDDVVCYNSGDSGGTSEGFFREGVTSEIRLLNSYTEYSQSGTGCHVIVKGKLSGNHVLFRRSKNRRNQYK